MARSGTILEPKSQKGVLVWLLVVESLMNLQLGASQKD